MTNPMTPELKACPFCGSTPLIETRQKTTIWCNTCEIGPSVKGFTPQGTAEAWNARTAAEAEGVLLEFQTSVMRESTQRVHRLEAQLYPLRELARISDLVWRDAVRQEEGEENYYKVSPRFMEMLAHELTKVDAALPPPPRKES